MENEIKKRIKLKSGELFHKFGIKTITMDEIAGQLGISKKTIYLYFKDKDELVDAVFTDIMCRNQEYCEETKKNAKNAIHEGFMIMKIMEKMFENLNPVTLFDLERNHPKTFNKFHLHKYNFLFTAIIENIEWGKKEGLYREDLESEVAAKVRLENMMLPFNQDIFPTGKFNLTDLQKQLIEFFLYSIVTPKGYKFIMKYKAQFK